MKFLMSAVATSILLTSTSFAFAKCTKQPYNVNWRLKSSDQRISGEQLSKMVVGKSVKLKGGTEVYGDNGGYKFIQKGKVSEPEDLRIYDDGSRCISYGLNKVVNLYVLNGGKLYLITGDGGRSRARIK